MRSSEGPIPVKKPKNKEGKKSMSYIKIKGRGNGISAVLSMNEWKLLQSTLNGFHEAGVDC